VEFRAPDPSSNPYLCFAALLLAGLDGIQNQIDPGDPFDKDLYELPAEEAKLIKQVPGSLGDVLDALEADHEFLLKGDVFTMDLLDAYMAYKKQTEIDPVRMRPHPYEFTLYFDVYHLLIGMGWEAPLVGRQPLDVGMCDRRVPMHTLLNWGVLKCFGQQFSARYRCAL
jgi:hypothetical protein